LGKNFGAKKQRSPFGGKPPVWEKWGKQKNSKICFQLNPDRHWGKPRLLPDQVAEAYAQIRPGKKGALR